MSHTTGQAEETIVFFTAAESRRSRPGFSEAWRKLAIWKQQVEAARAFEHVPVVARHVPQIVAYFSSEVSMLHNQQIFIRSERPSLTTHFHEAGSWNRTSAFAKEITTLCH